MVWEAAKVFASGVSHAAKVAVDAAKTLWRWWNTYVPRWVRWALYGAGIMFIVYLILGFGMPGVVAGMESSFSRSSELPMTILLSVIKVPPQPGFMQE